MKITENKKITTKNYPVIENLIYKSKVAKKPCC